MEIVRVSGLQMFLWVFALHDSLHHPSGSNFVAQPDAQVHKIPTGNKDQKKGQHFSRAHNEFDHRSFSLVELDEWNTATSKISRELSIPFVQRLHLKYFR